MEKIDNYPFYAWMPRPVGCLVLFLMFFPVTFSGGAYMNNLAEMAGGMSVYTIWLLVGTIAFVLFFPYHRDEYA